MARQFHKLIEQTWTEKILFSVLFELTYACNLNCFYCYNNTNQEGRELSVDQYMRLLDTLESMGTMFLTLSGGEPLLSPHFFPIGIRARKNGFVVRIKSNGYGLRTELIKRIQNEIDPYIIELSLHGSCAETHDRQTRVSGSFVKLLENLDGMRSAGIRVQLNAALTAWNEDEVADMFELADNLDISLKFDYRVTPRDNGDRMPLTIAPSRAGMKNMLGILTARAKDAQANKPEYKKHGKTDQHPHKGIHHCGAGSGSLVIDPWGSVYPCVQWRNPVGNIHDNSIDHIWLNSVKLEQIRAITQKVKKVVDEKGEAARLAGFCPALAEQLEGKACEFDLGTESYISLIKELGLDCA